MGKHGKKNCIRAMGLTAILSSLAGLALTGASMMPGFGAQPATAKAEISPSTAAYTQTASISDQLITPVSYEEYLPLTAPMDVAVSSDYTAIADGNVIYVYNRAEGVYHAYEHSLSATPAMNQVTQLAFSEAGDLYFIDGAPYLYVLTRIQLSMLDSGIQATNTHFTCSAFTLEGNRIYFTHISGATANLSYTTLNRLETSAAHSLVDGIPGSTKPTLTYYDKAIYYTQYTNLLRIDPYSATAEPELVCAFNDAVESLVISGGELFLTDELGDFYVYSLAQLESNRHASYVTPTASDLSGEYKSLSLFGQNVYAVRNQSIREYTIGKTFTDYEIGANSDSVHRLNGATDTLYKDGKLYTADSGNNRITIHTPSDGSYLAMPTPQSPTLVAATETTYAAANAHIVWLFNADGQLATIDGFNGKLVGLEGVYGKYYAVTDTNRYYVIELLPTADPNNPEAPSQSLSWQKTGGKEKTTSLTPQLLSSDVYGNLYVATQSGGLRKFTEAEFALPESAGIELTSSIPASATSLAVDLDENVYASKGNKLYRFAYNAISKTCSSPTTHSLARKLVYSQNDSTPITSFTFDINDKRMFVTYSGNLTASLLDMPFKTTHDVKTEGIEKTIFAQDTATFQVVDVSANALLIRFDLNKLYSDHLAGKADYFSYETHQRKQTAQTALLLGKVGDYSVISLYDYTTHKYGNYLVKTRYSVQGKAEGDYLVNYPSGSEKTGYTTNEIPLYKYPYLNDLLQVTWIAKGTKVRFIGEVNDLDYSYYKVIILDENGNQQIGFIPKPYTTLFDSTPKETTTTTYGEATPDTDSISRLIFLLLGTAAIGVLIDLLLLRKRPQED